MAPQNFGDLPGDNVESTGNKLSSSDVPYKNNLIYLL